MTKYKYLHVITGGPAAGKSSLIEDLSKRGMLTIAEEARSIIQEELAVMGDAVPWENKEKYAIKMLRRSCKTYLGISKEQRNNSVFFDRGILDTICYIKMENLSLPLTKDTEQFDKLYAKDVFILPPWKSIYKTDKERKQDWETAVYTYECLKQTYSTYGYTLIEVPKGSIAERTDFIINHIKGVTND